MKERYGPTGTVSVGAILLASVAAFAGCRSTGSSLPLLSRSGSSQPAAAYTEPSAPQQSPVASNEAPVEDSRTAAAEKRLVSGSVESNYLSSNNSLTGGSSTGCTSGCCSH